MTKAFKSNGKIKNTNINAKRKSPIERKLTISSNEEDKDYVLEEDETLIVEPKYLL